jgi:hypothetical protein
LHDSVQKDLSAFAEIARAHSDDIQTAGKGGLLKPFSRGTQDSLLERASFSLQEDGAISSVIEFPDKFIIIQRVQKQSQTYKPLKEVRGTIVKQLKTGAFKDLFSQKVQQHIQSENFDPAFFVKEHNGIKKELTDIVQSKKSVAKALFALQVGQYGFYIEGDNGYIVRLNTIETQHTPSFDAVHKTVQQDLIAQRAHEAFQKEGERIYALAKKHGIEKAAADGGFALNTIIPYSAKDTERVKDIKAKGIDPISLLRLEHVGSVTSLPEHDILYIVACTSIESPKNIDTQELQPVEKSVTQQQVQLFSQGYVASLYRDATIETSDIIEILEEENTI